MAVKYIKKGNTKYYVNGTAERIEDGSCGVAGIYNFTLRGDDLTVKVDGNAVPVDSVASKFIRDDIIYWIKQAPSEAAGFFEGCKKLMKGSNKERYVFLLKAWTRTLKKEIKGRNMSYQIDKDDCFITYTTPNANSSCRNRTKETIKLVRWLREQV